MTSPDDKKSLLDNLREPVQAWMTAGSRFGEVVSGFAERLKEDRAEEADTSEATRLRAAVEEVRTGLADAKSLEDYRKVSVAFAGRAEEIVRDFAGSVRRAVDDTRESSAVEEAREAFSRATSTVRSTIDDAVSQVRSRREEGAGFTPTAPSTNGDGDIPHMIDGEVISSQEMPDTRKDNQNPQ